MSNPFTSSFARALIVLLAAACAWTIDVRADDEPARLSGQHGVSNHRSPSSEFIAAVRAATERFKDVEEAEDAGYELMFGCVSGPDWGAMGRTSDAHRR